MLAQTLEMIVIGAAPSDSTARDILPIVGAIAAAAVPVMFTARSFLRQKEYELVRDRYLQQGFDEVIGTGERALNSHSHNWGHALNVLKVFRDVPSELELDELSLNRFRESERTFPYAAVGRVIRVTQSRAPWEAVQLIVAFANRSYELCVIEVPKVIKAHIGGRTNADGPQIAEDCASHLKELMREADAYFNALGEISAIAYEFETSALSFKGLGHFAARPKVVESIRKLEQFVGDRHKDLSEMDDKHTTIAAPEAR